MAVRLDHATKTVTITNLTTLSPDLYAVLAAEPQHQQEQKLLDIIALASAVLSRIPNATDETLEECVCQPEAQVPRMPEGVEVELCLAQESTALH